MRDIVWLGDSLKRLRAFPEGVREEFGYLLYRLQCGEMPKSSKLLRGIKPSVLELIASYDTNAYRLACALRIAKQLFVLHAFQKKSKFTIKTPKPEIDLIKQRLHQAIEYSRKHEVLV